MMTRLTKLKHLEIYFEGDRREDEVDLDLLQKVPSSLTILETTLRLYQLQHFQSNPRPSLQLYSVALDEELLSKQELSACLRYLPSTVKEIRFKNYDYVRRLRMILKVFENASDLAVIRIVIYKVECCTPMEDSEKDEQGIHDRFQALGIELIVDEWWYSTRPDSDSESDQSDSEDDD